MTVDWMFEAIDPGMDIGEFSSGLELAPLLETAHPLDKGLKGVLSSAEELGIMSNEILGPLETIGGALMLTAGAMMAYNATKGIILALTGAEQALATAEAAIAAVNPATWANLAIAGVAAASVYSGIQFASGTWQFPAININSTTQREQAMQAIKAVNGNG